MYKFLIMLILLFGSSVVALANPCDSYKGDEQTACNNVVNNPNWYDGVRQQVFEQNKGAQSISLPQQSATINAPVQPPAATAVVDGSSSGQQTVTNPTVPQTQKPQHQDIFQ